MPIYSYRCETCGFQQDTLRKMSDPPLVTCPSCGAATFRKQVTAAGFQLKGSGWYVTDFRNPASKDAGKAAKGDGESPAASGDDGGKPAASPADASTSAKPAASGESKADAQAEAKPAKPAAPPATGST